MEHYIKIAQIKVAKAGDTIKTVVGSCIALCLTDIVTGTSGMVHIMMPEKKPGHEEEVGKYANTAVPALLELMLDAGCDRMRLKAKISGGASMFNTDLSISIGLQNKLAVVSMLQKVDIPLKFEDTGGTSGRTVVVECGTGQLFIRSLNGATKKG